jgi:hypothetical protein
MLQEWEPFGHQRLNITIRDENFLGKPGFPGFSSDFQVFQSGYSPFKFKFSENDPQFVLSTLKCNNAKSLKTASSP